MDLALSYGIDSFLCLTVLYGLVKDFIQKFKK